MNGTWNERYQRAKVTLRLFGAGPGVNIAGSAVDAVHRMAAEIVAARYVVLRADLLREARSDWGKRRGEWVDVVVAQKVLNEAVAEYRRVAVRP